MKLKILTLCYNCYDAAKRNLQRYAIPPPAMLFPPRYAISSLLCYSLPAMLFPPCYAISFLLRYSLMLCYFLPLYPLPMLLPYYYNFPIWLLCDVLHQNLTIHTKFFYCKFTETPFEKLRSLQSALSGRNDYTDQPRTPHRRAQRDRQDRRDFSGGSQFRQSSRSRSPHPSAPSRVFSKRRTSPPPHHQASSSFHSPSRQPFFRSGADSKGPPVCAVCLGRNICEIGKCRSENFWDGSKARCRKNEQGRLITPTGTILCHDWNTRRGCPSTVHGQRHECSGCGKRDHGAQNCARAQKEKSPHTL